MPHRLAYRQPETPARPHKRQPGVTLTAILNRAIAAGLSERERTVLALKMLGLANKEVGLVLGVREDTVKQYTWLAYNKLGLKDDGERANVIQALRVLYGLTRKGTAP